MRHFIAPLVALSMLGWAGAASADETTGKVREIDMAANVIILEDGHRFKLVGANVEGIEPGDTVKVEYMETDEGVEASAVVKVDM